MSVAYTSISWNGFKIRCDQLLGSIIALFLLLFIGIGIALFPTVTVPILIIRATGTIAFILLHFILTIGPMARLDTRWLPLLYNRRHLGVSLFLLTLIHAGLTLILYHGFTDLNPFVSLFMSDSGNGMLGFPFQVFGFFALLIFFLMAATSHDFWLANLTAPIWKALHQLVYLAYALLIFHVSFGILQSEISPIYTILVGLGLIWCSGLHLFAGWRGRGIDIPAKGKLDSEGYLSVCKVSDLEENTPLGATVSGERIAILLYETNKVSVVSGVCQHQNGPLAEGKIINGCLTCPWHGYQYRPEDGCSPPPFNEKIPTFLVKIIDYQVWIHPKPLEAGTKSEPALIL